MAKKIKSFIKLQIPAGQANPSPPVGPALGQAGVNIMEFCKAFNAKTQETQPGTPTPVVITVYTDKSFTFITKKPPVSYYLKQAAKVKKGASTTGTQTIGSVTVAQLEEIAAEKMPDLNAVDVKGAVEMLKGSARSMGLEVKE